MRTLFISAVLASFSLNAAAQSTSQILKQEAGEGVKQGANVATQKTAEKGKSLNMRAGIYEVLQALFPGR